MSWDHELTRRAKHPETQGPDSGYYIGDVLSPRWSEEDEDWTDGPLIISILDGQAMLTEEMVDRLGAGGRLHEGMTVTVIPGEKALRGGQRFFVLEIPGHGDTAGRDAADSHPVGAITGLREELDNHNSRLVQIETVRLPDLETRRVPNLEHDMYDSDGKVPLLTVRVGNLETGKADKGHTHTYADVSGLSGLAEQVAGLVAQGGEANVIETVKRNGTALPVTGKAVDVSVPVNVSELTNDSGYQDARQVQTAAQTAVSAGMASLLTAETYGPASTVSFEAAYGGLPLRKLLVSIEPVQAGSGVPSPSNVRAISGRTGAEIYVSPTATAGDGKTYAADWTTEAGTVYGGTLDVLTGTLTVEWTCKTLAGTDIQARGGSATAAGDYRFYCQAAVSAGILLPPNAQTAADVLCSVAAAIPHGDSSLHGVSVNRADGRIYLHIRDCGQMTLTQFRSWVDSHAVQVAFKLASPVTYRIGAQAVTAPAGQNNIWADCGDVTAEYGAFLQALQQEIETIMGGG